jgi:CubicO group peptidase (beta-lactamase class C family)
MGVGIVPNNPINTILANQVDAFVSSNADLAEVVRTLAAVPLLYQPGTRWSYSLSLDVIARLVEAVSGQPYHDFLKRRLFEPLGMKDTVYTVRDDQLDRFSALYGIKAGETQMTLLEAPQESPDYLLKPRWTPGSFGLISSAPDFWRFAQMLLQGGEFEGERILGPRTVALMAANHLPPNLLPYHFDDSPPIQGYGHGLGVHVLMDHGLAGTPCANGEYWKDGGAGTLCWIDPTYDLVGLVMYQHVPHWIYPVFAQFKALAYQAIC